MKKITDLNIMLTVSTVDVIPIVDIVNNETKQISVETFFNGVKIINWENPITISTLSTLSVGNHYICEGTTTDYNIFLPSPTLSKDKFVSLQMSSCLSKLVTINSSLIDGEPSRIMWANETALLKCDGNSWTKISGKSVPMSFLVVRDSSQTDLDNSVAGRVNFNVKLHDFGGVFSLTTFKSTPKRPNKWQFNSTVTLGSNSGGNMTRLIGYFYKSDLPLLKFTDLNGIVVSQSGGCGISGAAVIDMEVGSDCSVWGLVVCVTGTTDVCFVGGTNVVPYNTSFSGHEIISW